MAKSIRNAAKKQKPGRLKTAGHVEGILVRLDDSQLAELDNWIDAQVGPRLSRAEGICRLVKTGLQPTRPNAGRNHRAAARASKLAAEHIDKLVGTSANTEQHQRGKRRLIKGPKEFREIRCDQPKPKSR